MKKVLIIGSGERVLGVTSYFSKGLREVRELIYGSISKISVSGEFYYRKNIGIKELK